MNLDKLAEDIRGNYPGTIFAELVLYKQEGSVVSRKIISIDLDEDDYQYSTTDKPITKASHLKVVE